MASKCHKCGEVSTPVWDANNLKFCKHIQVCRPCAESGKAEWHSLPFSYKELFAQKGWAFAEVHPSMPEAFKETERDRLPSVSMQLAFDWKPGEKRSLLLHGTTGSGKTRVAWAVFNRLWRENYPFGAEFLPMWRIEGKIEKGFGEREHADVIEHLINVPLLVLDDLGKEKLTPRLECDLFAVMDERTARHAVTIITTNYNSQTLAARFGNAETGPAFVRRLKDYFKTYGA